MIPVREKSVIQIEITNACVNECTNCSRFVGHYKNTYFMELEQVENCIHSLDGFKGCIGIMGGEPLMHPEFEEICALMRKHVPPDRRRLWTSGYNWDKYSQIIHKTFGEYVRFNNHSDTTQKHHPMLLSISDVVRDRELIRQLVDDCWVDQRWSASINPKGGFFCEIAAAMDVLFEGAGGHPLEQGWWDKDPEAFRDQVESYCYRCGACVPYSPVTLNEGDVASASNYARLKEIDSPKLRESGVRLHEEEISKQQLEEFARQWQPWNHLGAMGTKGQGRDQYGLYGKLSGYSLKVKDSIRSKCWTFRRVEMAFHTLLWRIQTKWM